ncbi:AI-2E family transporter [Hydrogenophaga defluvii]|uniref:AI-2E family transporter n=1 Tax=Hydrogenophaga defluvii TaxID=249410 RepID=A0ABW2SCT2_9BURK
MMTLLLAVVTLAFVAILSPFLTPMLWALIIALVFAPVFRHTLRWTGERRTLAALLTLAGVLLLVVLPLSLLGLALLREATGVYERLQSGEWNPGAYLHRLFDALPNWVGALLDRFGLTSFNTIVRRINTSVSQGLQSVGLVAVDVGQEMVNFLAKLFITLYLAFFMVRDGDAIAHTLREALPLPLAHKRALFRTFATVLRATVKGHLVVAVVQGALGGVAFWALGLPASLLWAVLMALLSLLPVVGSGLVWLPMALYLVASGALWQGLALIAFGVLVIGLIDNLLRPVLVGRDTRLPDYLVMVATLGGLATFGVNGLVLGPAIAALFVAAWKIDVAGRERP